jgi:hypothetical protein
MSPADEQGAGVFPEPSRLAIHTTRFNPVKVFKVLRNPLKNPRLTTGGFFHFYLSNFSTRYRNSL